MGSLSNLSSLAGKVEDVFSTVGGKQDAERKTDDILWAEIIRIGNQGPNDTLWKKMDAVWRQTLVPAGKEYASYEDWLDRVSRLWLTTCSIRHLLVKWAQINPNKYESNPPAYPVTQKAPEMSDMSPSFEVALKNMQWKTNIHLRQAGVALAPDLDFDRWKLRLKMKRKIDNVSIAYLSHDRSTAIGLSDYDVVAAPQTTPFKKKHHYAFDKHEMDLPISWRQEMMPTKLYANTDMRNVPALFQPVEVSVQLAIELLREAHALKIPLVVRDDLQAPVQKKTP